MEKEETMSSTAFQIVSDLHLETQAAGDTFVLQQTAPNLALLGDIGQVADADSRLFAFLEKQLRRYWSVFFLLGNHEPVGTSWPMASAAVHRFAERMERLRARSTIGRFVFLDRTRYDVSSSLTVLGCTLFSAVATDQQSAVASRLIDFRQISGWDVSRHNDAHADDLRWLNAQVAAVASAEPHRQVVIFTHHSPTLDVRATDPRHCDSPVASGFASDLRHEVCWTSPAVALWAFGHTHWNCDFVDEASAKRVVANQRGYALEHATGFNAKNVYFVGGEQREDAGEKPSTQASR